MTPSNPQSVADSVARLEQYPNVRIAANGSWLEITQTTVLPERMTEQCLTR